MKWKVTRPLKLLVSIELVILKLSVGMMSYRVIGSMLLAFSSASLSACSQHSLIMHLVSAQKTFGRYSVGTQHGFCGPCYNLSFFCGVQCKHFAVIGTIFCCV